MILYCVRHGETEANAAGRIQGQSDTLLSALGRRQTEHLAAALADASIDAIYSSPLRRAIDTATAIADALRLPIISEPGLMEIKLGLFQGHTWEEIFELHPEPAKGWRSKDPDYRVPGGETRREVMDRAREAFVAIRGSAYRRPLIVSHGGLLSAAFKALLDIPPSRSPFRLANGSISKLAWEEEIQLLTVNETGHLGTLVTAGGQL